MKKVLKVLGKALLVLAICLAVFLLVVFGYNGVLYE